MGSDFGVDMDKVREFVARKTRARNAALDERFQRATLDFRAIVERIIDEAKPKRIYQWGSLLHRERFSEISDIDIAVEGLTGAEQFFQVLGIAMDGTSFPVDVVEIEKVPESVERRIREKGKLVYERTDP